MKKLFFVLLTALSAAFIFNCGVYANDGAASRNIHGSNYIKYGVVVSSDLYENGGGLERVEFIDNKVIIEKYSLDGEFVSAIKEIPAPLPLYGGFYSGEKYNYLVFGAQNINDDNSVEVVRLQKYSKDWQLLKECPIYGANTFYPFDAGSARMTEAGGKLYLYTCHEMYKSGDGLHHQSNLQFIIDIDSFESPSNPSSPYASHSFNQFIQTDGEYIYTIDHGDAYPRSVVMRKYEAGKTSYSVKSSTVLGIVGKSGDNYTGVSVGGFELSANNALVAGNTVEQNADTFSTDKQRNIFIGVAPKDMSAPSIKMLTNYTADDGVSPYTPYLIKLSDTRFLVMWEEYSSQKYITKIVTIDENGNTISSTQNKLPLSLCKPVKASDGFLHWYVTNNTAPITYWLDPVTYEAQKIPEEDWEFDTDSKTLTIGGKGELPTENLPWSEHYPEIKHLVIKKGVSSISDNAFEGCALLEDVTLSDTVFSVGDAAFKDCTSLKSVSMSDKVNNIGTSAFYGCSALKSIDLPQSITQIAPETFQGCSALESIDIPESVTDIGGYAFKDCSSLVSIKLPPNLTAINNYTFYGCEALKTVSFPESIKSIGFCSFENCSALESVDMPPTLSSISGGAFENCFSLKSIVIPEGVKSIQGDTFREDKALETVIFPSTLTSIGTSSFYNCKALTKADIPDSVQKIYSWAFYGCKLKTANIPDGITSIGSGTFYGCPLEEINIPNSVKTIGQAAFSYSRAKYVTIPPSVESIGYLSFYIPSMTALAIPESVSSIDDSAIVVNYNITIYCTKGSKAEEFAAEKNVAYKYVGDMDGDKELTDKDAKEILNYASGSKTVNESDTGKRALLDCDYDRECTVLDAIKHLNNKK